MPAALPPLPFVIRIGGVDWTTRCRVSGCAIVQNLNSAPDTFTLRVIDPPPVLTTALVPIPDPMVPVTGSNTGVGGLSFGAYGWFVTLVDAGGGETRPSPSTGLFGFMAFMTAGSSATVTIPIGPTGTVARKLYRSHVNGNVPGLVATIADNTTTTVVDALADSGIGAAPPTENTTGPHLNGLDLTVDINGVREFAGHIPNQTALHEGPAIRTAWDLTCTDDTLLLNRRKVIKRYTGQTGDAIIADLLATFTSGFTSSLVGLPVIAEITFSDEDVTDCLDKVVKNGGAVWLADYTRVVRVFLTDPTPADSITDADVHGMITIHDTTDRSQARTRIWVTGRGSTASSDVPVGWSTLPVGDGAPFVAAGGGMARLPSQRIAYASVAAVARLGNRSIGGAGTIPGGCAAAPLNNSDGPLGVGAFQYRVTDVGPDGETGGSAPSAGTIAAFGGVGAPSAAQVAGAPGGLSFGAFGYQVTFANANGETAYDGAYAIGGIAISQIATPGTPTATAFNNTGGVLVAGTYKYGVSFVDAGGETVPGAVASVFVAGGASNGVALTAIPVSSDARVTARKIYRSKVNGSALFYLTTINDNATTVYAYDLVADTALVVPAPVANTSGTGQVALTGIPLGPAGTTARHIYRTLVNVGPAVGTLRRLTTIGDNTTTVYTDTTPDTSLGDLILAVRTADGGQMALSGIPVGPAGTTARKIYRSIVGGSVAWLLLTTIPDNTTTVYTDNTPDSALGDPLGPGSIQALPGDLALAVFDLTPFAGRGWVRAGSQVLAYSGTSGSSLVGIPASGPGSITSPIAVGTDVRGEPHLTGVSGMNTAVVSGESVQVLVMREDLTAALQLKLAEGGDGIHEDVVSGGDISIAEAGALADATLAYDKDFVESVSYTTRNPSARPGRDQVVNLTHPAIVGTYKIQRVQLTELGEPNEVWPLRTVDASSRRESLEAVFRRVLRGGSASASTTSAASLAARVLVGLTGGGPIAVGTPGQLPKFLTANTLADSIAREDGRAIVIDGTLAATAVVGDGAGLTALSAAQLVGTIPAPSLTARSLADLGTRDAGDLTGTLAYAQLPSGAGRWVADPTIAGVLTAAQLVASTITTPTASDLVLSPTGNLRLVPTGTYVLPGANYTVNLGAPNCKFLSLTAAELIVESLVAADVRSTVGGRVLVAPTTKLVADLAAAATMIAVKHNNLASGDRIHLETRGSVEWMAVTSGATGPIGDDAHFTYTVTRNLDGSGANDWLAGDGVVNTRQTGDGFIDLYAAAGVLSGIGPTIVGNVRTGSTYSAIEPRWAIGNLNGLYGYGATTYGACFGSPTGAWLKIDPVNGVRIGFNATTHTQIDAAGAASFESGGVRIDPNGIVITPDTALGSGGGVHSYRFTATAGQLGTYGVDDTGALQRGVVVQSRYNAGTGGTFNYITLSAYNDAGGTTHGAALNVTASQTASAIGLIADAVTVSGTLAVVGALTAASLVTIGGISVGTLLTAGALQSTSWATFNGALDWGGGAAIPSSDAIPATSLTGTLADARLSANVPLLNALNVFAGSAGAAIQITRTGGAPSIVGTTDLIVDGSATSGQLELNAISSGAVRIAGGGGTVFVSSAVAGAANRATLKSLANESSGWALHQTSTTYSTAPSNADDPANIASATHLVSGRGGGLNLIASNGPIRFYAGSVTEAMRIHASRGVSLGSTTDPGAGNLSVSGNLSITGHLDFPSGVPSPGSGTATFVSTSAPWSGTRSPAWLPITSGGTGYVPVFF